MRCAVPPSRTACGGSSGDAPLVRKFVSQQYVDPSVEFLARKEAAAARSGLRVKTE